MVHSKLDMHYKMSHLSNNIIEVQHAESAFSCTLGIFVRLLLCCEGNFTMACIELTSAVATIQVLRDQELIKKKYRVWKFVVS